jgi:hypothetical protein
MRDPLLHSLFAVTTYSLTWWDNEMDSTNVSKSSTIPPKKEIMSLIRNPEAAAARGLWGEEKFQKTQAARNSMRVENHAICRFSRPWMALPRRLQSRSKGNWLDKCGRPSLSRIRSDLKAVHLAIHLEKGMHCTDCHFTQDNHGTGKFMASPALRWRLIVDCHGTIRQKATLITSDRRARRAPPGEPAAAISKRCERQKGCGDSNGATRSYFSAP